MRVCGQCDTPLTRRPGEGSRDFNKRRFCGYSCSVLSRSAARAADREARRRKRCVWCGDEFVAESRLATARYSSRACSNRAKASRQRDAYDIVDMGYKTPCYVRRGSKTPGGYGKVTVDYESKAWHRWMYEKFIGPIPFGFHLDHLCEVRACGRPDHLEPVTPAENTHRSWVRGRHDGKRGQRKK